MTHLPGEGALQRNNAVTALCRDTLMEQNSLWGEKSRPMVMNDEMESLDINTPFEFSFANYLAQHKHDGFTKWPFPNGIF